MFEIEFDRSLIHFQTFTRFSYTKFLRKCWLFFMLLGIGISQPAKAQPRPPLPVDNYQIELRTHYGIHLHHHIEFQRFNAEFSSFELSFQRSTFGRQKWEALYSYPLIGFSFFYSDMGGFKELGNAYALYPFINFPLNQDLDNRLTFRLGVGLGYLTNKFDPVYNHKNFAIGSHLNAAVSMFFDYRRTINQRFTFIAAAGLTHFSNGSSKTPNYGLNMVSAAVGLNAFINRPNAYLKLRFQPVLRPFEYDNKKWFTIELMQSFGTKDMSQQIGGRHYVTNTAVHLMFPLSLKYKLGLGLETTYNGGDKALLDNKTEKEQPDEPYYTNQLQLFKHGISLSYELILSKTSFLFNLGYHNEAGNITNWIAYQKVGIKYLFTDQLFGTIALTAHAGRADFIGYGIGYKWDFKYYLHRNKAKLKM